MIAPLCLILGDSIADGVQRALSTAGAPSCAVVARVGTSSTWAARHSPRLRYASVVIATGSNDARVPGLGARLLSLRRTISASRVLWITPYDRSAARAVAGVAHSFGDKWMDIAELSSRDGVHPRSYGALARSVRRFGYAGG